MQTADSFLATKISFINMVSDLCEEIGVEVATVARGIGLDPRIGSHFLNAGLGFGGPCLPRDLSALIKVAEGNGVDVGMLREVERINTARVNRLLAKVERALWVVWNKVIAVFGVAFKPDTDDIRGAPSLGVIPRLHGAGAILRVNDPAATRKFERLYPPDDRLTYVESAFFDDVAFDRAWAQANEIADMLRWHGPFEPHRLPLEEMEYTTLPQIMSRLADRSRATER